MTKLKQRLFWLIAITILSSLLYFGQPILWPSGMSDSGVYSWVMDYFRGQPEKILEFGQGDASSLGTRPLLPLLALPFSAFFSDYTSMAIVNLLYWIGTVILLYLLVKHLYTEKTAFITALLYSASLVPIAYNSRPLTDCGSYFFFILLIYYVEVYVRSYGAKELAWLGLVFALALLHKESSFFALVYVGVDLLYRYSILEAVKKGIGVGVTFLLALIPVTLWKNATGASWFVGRNRQASPIPLLVGSIPAFLFRTFITFHIGWIFAIYGIWQDSKRRKYYIKCVITLILPVLLGWLTAPPYSPRFAHFLFPLVLPAFAYGLEKSANGFRQPWLRKNWVWIVIIIYYAISYFGASLFPSQDINAQTNLVQSVWEEFKNKWLSF